MPSGLSAALAITDRSTASTKLTQSAEAPKDQLRLVEFLDEGLELDVSRIESNGLRPGRVTRRQYIEGTRKIMGDLMHEWGPSTPLILILKHCFGGYSFTAADSTNAALHTITPGNLDDKFLNTWISRPQVEGDPIRFLYTGVQVTSFELTNEINEYCKLNATTYGRDLNNTQSGTGAVPDIDFDAVPASGKIDTAYDYETQRPLAYTDCTAKVDWTGGTTFAAIYIMGFTLNGDNALKTDRFFIEPTLGDSGKTRAALENDFRTYTGSLNFGEYLDSNYNRYLAAQPNFTLEFIASNGMTGTAERSITITLRGRLDKPSGPNVSGRELIELDIPFTLFSGTSDADAITVEIRGPDTDLS